MGQHAVIHSPEAGLTAVAGSSMPACSGCLTITPLAPACAFHCRAIELYDQDVSFLSNRAAVHFEKADYEECIKDCDAGGRCICS